MRDPAKTDFTLRQTLLRVIHILWPSFIWRKRTGGLGLRLKNLRIVQAMKI